MVGLCLGLLAGGLGCATGSGDGGSEARVEFTDDMMPQNLERTGEKTHDGLVRVKSPAGPQVAVYLKPPRPYLQRYDRMILAPVMIRYKAGVKPWTEQHENTLRRSFRKMLLDSLDKGPHWALVEEVDEGVLLVRVSVLDIDIDRSMQDSSNVSYRQRGGGAVVVFELYDSVTTEPLLRHVERRIMPGGVYSGSNIDRVRLQHTLEDFAHDMGRNLRVFYEVIREIERREQALEGEDSNG